MSWQQYVQAAQGLGFTKVTIISRPQNGQGGYQVLGYTSAADIATAWKDTDKDGKQTDINENQELLDEWNKKDIKFDPAGKEALLKKTFCFYGKKYNIILRECENDDFHTIVCAQGNDVCIAAQFKTIWFVAYGQKKKMSMKKESKEDKKKKQEGFSGAQQAYGKIMGSIWDALAEAGV